MTLLAEKDVDTQTGTSYSLDWSADGETLAVGAGIDITLLDRDLGRVIATLTPSTGAIATAWSPDKHSLATASGARNPRFTIWGWDGATARLTTQRQVAADTDQYGVSWSPNGRLLATLANDRRSIIQIWDTSTWMLLHTFTLPYANPRRALNWSAGSDRIFDAGELDGQVVYFGLNVNDGSVQELGKRPVKEGYAVTFSPDLTRIALADEGGQVRILDIGSGAIVAEFRSVAEPADLAWNPKDATLAILGSETALQLWTMTPQ